MAQVSLMPGAEPWAADGDGVGVLFVHGFTGTPQSMRYWAERIQESGRTVVIPRLPGHGTSPRDLGNYGPEDWVQTAEEALRGLWERCDKVFICALSMGGTITYDLATRYSDRLAGIVVVNGPVYTKDPRAKLAPLLGKVPLLLKGPANDIADPAAKEVAYSQVSTIAAAKLIKYMAEVQRRIGRVTCPALIFTSAQDHIVHPSNGPYIYEHISSKDKRHVLLEKSYHVATLDYDKDLIVFETEAFIAAH
jgi:carboxylesterase